MRIPLFPAAPLKSTRIAEAADDEPNAGALAFHTPNFHYITLRKAIAVTIIASVACWSMTRSIRRSRQLARLDRESPCSTPPSARGETPQLNLLGPATWVGAVAKAV